MNHHVIAHIDAYMRDSLYFRSHGALEENQISGTNIFRINLGTERMQSCRTAPP